MGNAYWSMEDGCPLPFSSLPASSVPRIIPPMPEEKLISGESSSCANVALTPAVLLRIARGFLCFFWGLPIGLLLFTGALSFPTLPRIRLPAYVVGVLIAYCGVMYLKRTGPLTALWNRRLRFAILLMLLQVYLAPFVHWWKRVPSEPYFAANVIVLLLVTAWTFFVINMLAAELARVLHDSTFRIEAQISAWISFVFMLAPLLEVVAVSVSLYAESGSLFLVELPPAIFMLPRWASVFALVSFTSTMAVTWKAKGQALNRVSACAMAAKPENQIR